MLKLSFRSRSRSNALATRAIVWLVGVVGCAVRPVAAVAVVNVGPAGLNPLLRANNAANYGTRC